jgi:hypothetical protein
MLARWKVIFSKLSDIAMHGAAIHARHPLERWLSMVEEDRKAIERCRRSLGGFAKSRHH